MSDGILLWKKCAKCGEFFDIGTNERWCPKCRKKWQNVINKEVWEYGRY